jgi:DNA-binding HxlR family transcriptional regulator
MTLTAKSLEVFNEVKANGGRISVTDLAAKITDLQKKELVIRDKVAVEGAEKAVVYVVLTDAGVSFVPSEE